MGADNWDICPKCESVSLAQKQSDIDKARDSYGKVSPEEYEALLLKSRMTIEQDLTLRENYELGIFNTDEHTKHFEVSYTASCDKCGFKHRFLHKERINLNGR